MIPRVCAAAVAASVVCTGPCAAMEAVCLADDMACSGAASVVDPVGPCAGNDFGFVDGVLDEALRSDLLAKVPGNVTSALKARLPLDLTRFELDVPLQLAQRLGAAITCEAAQIAPSLRLPAAANDGKNVSTHMETKKDSQDNSDFVDSNVG